MDPVYNRVRAFFVINPDGTGRQQLGRSSGFGPTWSPDGSKIAFFRQEGDFIERSS